MAFAYLRDKFELVRKLVDHAGYGFGAARQRSPSSASALGIVHMVAERRKGHRAPLEAHEARVHHPRRRQARPYSSRGSR